ncbi:MAG: aminoacyl-tRNA hydrolase [Gemmatimonadota bacterium]
MKVVAGLGNPGAQYDATRHNVGWWVVDRLAQELGIGPFRKEGLALVARGHLDSGEALLLLKPVTYMNRSGAALAFLRGEDDTHPDRDLLVVVDDVSMEPGRVRIRPRGRPGGHNGLKSVSAVLGSDDYSRLRVGVGGAPPGWDLADWVLSPFQPEEEEKVVELLPSLAQAVQVWAQEGVQEAMNRFNR